MESILGEMDRNIKTNIETGMEPNMKTGIKGMDLCRKYYETFGIPMIREKFPEYEGRIAVGLSGEDSDCFGFDDEYSRDHDWGPGFCMWLTDEDYEKTGEELKKAYEELPKEFMGFRRVNTGQGGGRLGVGTVKEFFTRLLGTNFISETLFSIISNENSIAENYRHNDIKEKINWLEADEERLAAAVSGEIFRDDLGFFTNIRNLIKEYYPMDIRYIKLAESAVLYAQTGQYNFKRMLDRGDTVAAAMEAMKAVKETLRLINLINGQYCCHDKWLYHSTDFNFSLKKIPPLLQKISENATNPANVSIFEEISAIITKRMYQDNFISDEDIFMQNHAEELLTKAGYHKMNHTNLVEAIVKAEFAAYDKVERKGGRIRYQNDFKTFSIIRKSRYLLWTREMLIQYLYEFNLNFKNGRNMIEEKYGRMTEYAAPEEYERIKDSLPPLSHENEMVIEVIIAIEKNLMVRFAERYPGLAKNAGNMSSDGDSPDNASARTYLRSELSTYSDKMLEMYGRFLTYMQGKGKNIIEETIRNAVRMYGYDSLLEAEENL